MVSTRFVLLPVVFALATTMLSAQADPDRTVAGGGSFPPGWRVRTDVNRRTGQAGDLASVKFTNMGPGGMHTTVGPAAIYWRDADTASGNYHVVTTLTQMQTTPHREGFGIFIGGRSLGDSAQTYTYFLVSPLSGQFTIRRRTGGASRNGKTASAPNSTATIQGRSSTFARIPAGASCPRSAWS